MALRALALEIVRRLQTAGFSAYWVGGCVRDFLLGREPEDYDVATNAVPDQIEKLFPHTVPVGRQFGVVLVIEEGHQFQVATFRAESDYQDGRHPGHVTFGDAKADALRRDFTVNGLFFDPIRNQLHDWVGGEADLRARMLRTIGSPQERFAEDHLRLLRAVRLAAQLDFQIEPETFSAIQSNAAKIRAISAERIRDELLKLFNPSAFGVPPSGGGARLPARDRAESLASPKTGPPEGGTPNGLRAARGLDLLRDSGLLQEILPEIAETLDCEQSPDFHPEGNVYQHIRLMLSQLPENADPSLPWVILLHDVAKPQTAARDPHSGSMHFYGHEKIGAEMAEEILDRLKFPRKQTEEIVECVRHHMQFKDAPNMRKATVRRLILRPTFPLELELHRLDCLGSHGRLDVYDYLIREAEELSKLPARLPPLVNGDDLIGLGVKPGPALGALLTEIRDKQLQEELTSREEAVNWARKKIAAMPMPVSPTSS
ncbi:MAG TPA: CCA tRNA nucleotidyltransferase [Candidatus Eisenbacteria bacterium]|jgi:poly(A) polymerase|nr:CCA tRNA nucleotidyltransferase [Candidatus Eisenbacteria bacterium]